MYTVYFKKYLRSDYTHHWNEESYYDARRVFEYFSYDNDFVELRKEDDVLLRQTRYAEETIFEDFEKGLT